MHLSPIRLLLTLFKSKTLCTSIKVGIQYSITFTKHVFQSTISRAGAHCHSALHSLVSFFKYFVVFSEGNERQREVAAAADAATLSCRQLAAAVKLERILDSVFLILCRRLRLHPSRRRDGVH